jgi:DNA gyrase subunit B
MDFVLTYTANYSSTIVPYVNTGLTEKGPHISTFKTIITREFNKLFREKGWLKEKEENLSGDDIQEGMYIVFNLTAPNVGYDAQVKSNITKIDLTNFSEALSENLNIWFTHNEKDVKIIADKALAARRAREAAKKARDNARNLEVKSKTKFINLPTKLVDAWSKKRSRCELLITEGRRKLLPLFF